MRDLLFAAMSEKRPWSPLHEARAWRLFEARRRLLDGGSVEPWSIADLARAAGLSPSHFQRQFRAAFGETPHQAMIEARLIRARELLRETDLPITEICFECGYESLGSFSYLFRKWVGCSPREFRQDRRRFWPVRIEFMQRVVPFCLLDAFR